MNTKLVRDNVIAQTRSLTALIFPLTGLNKWRAVTCYPKRLIFCHCHLFFVIAIYLIAYFRLLSCLLVIFGDLNHGVPINES